MSGIWLIEDEEWDRREEAMWAEHARLEEEERARMKPPVRPRGLIELDDGLYLAPLTADEASEQKSHGYGLFAKHREHVSDLEREEWDREIRKKEEEKRE